MNNVFPIADKQVINKTANIMVVSVSFDPFTKSASGTIGLKNQSSDSNQHSIMMNDYIYQEPYEKTFLDTSNIDEQIKNDSAKILGVTLK